MPQRKEQFATGEIYHIIVRAIDDNLIFKDTNDHYRGIFSIYEFNNVTPVNIRDRRKQRKKEKTIEKIASRLPMSGFPDIGSRGNYGDIRDRLVDILCFCFMPNHIHLLVKQIKDNGVSRFMQKVGIGMSKYLNKKYQRKGHVFQDAFKSVRIENDRQLSAVFNYIHINPLSLIEPGWKEKGIKDIEKDIEFIDNYKWSSYQDYIGIKNFPSVTEREFLSDLMNDAGGCKNAIKDWLEYKKEITGGNNLFLE